jgi:hypothetical protein
MNKTKRCFLLKNPPFYFFPSIEPHYPRYLFTRIQTPHRPEKDTTLLALRHFGIRVKTVWYLTQNTVVFGVKHRGVLPKTPNCFSKTLRCFLRVTPIAARRQCGRDKRSARRLMRREVKSKKT